MNVHVGLLIELRLETEHGRAAAHDGHRRLDRLLHDFAELAGVRQLALCPARSAGFDRQQLAADFGPREPGDLTDLIVLLGAAVAEAPHAEYFGRLLRRDA